MLSSVCFSTGQAPVVLRPSQGAPQDVRIVVNEGNNVTFRCEITGDITVSVRPPEGGRFMATLPVNVMTVSGDNLVTITVVNAQRDENALAFQCAAGGPFTDIGVLTVYCKLCRRVL